MIKTELNNYLEKIIDHAKWGKTIKPELIQAVLSKYFEFNPLKFECLNNTIGNEGPCIRCIYDLSISI